MYRAPMSPRYGAASSDSGAQSPIYFSPGEYSLQVPHKLPKKHSTYVMQALCAMPRLSLQHNHHGGTAMFAPTARLQGSVDLSLRRYYL